MINLTGNFFYLSIISPSNKDFKRSVTLLKHLWRMRVVIFFCSVSGEIDDATNNKGSVAINFQLVTILYFLLAIKRSPTFICFALLLQTLVKHLHSCATHIRKCNQKSTLLIVYYISINWNKSLYNLIFFYDAVLFLQFYNGQVFILWNPAISIAYVLGLYSRLILNTNKHCNFCIANIGEAVKIGVHVQ